MANFKYFKVPMGNNEKFIKINRLPTHTLQRLADARFTNDERKALTANLVLKLSDIRIQAQELLDMRTAKESARISAPAKPKAEKSKRGKLIEQKRAGILSMETFRGIMRKLKFRKAKEVVA